MIDKTESKIELLLHAIINQMKLYLGIFTNAIKRFIFYAKCNKKRVGIIVGLIIFLIVSGICLYKYIPREVELIYDDSLTISQTSPKTQCRTVGDFLEEQNIEITTADTINCNLEDKITRHMEIEIHKAFDIPIVCDGKTVTLHSVSCKAINAVKKMKIKVKEDDIVLPGRNHMMKNGEKIVIKRVKIKYKHKDVTLYYKTEAIRTDKFRIGKRGTVVKGKNGKATKHYKLIYVDGKLYKKVLYATDVHKEPVTHVIGYGTRISMDGAPSGLRYRKMIRCTAVAYHFDGNPYGAGGRPCTYGTMAVDPRVIPMGTRCYVEGYGYAIANDVGTGVKGKKIDLYMEGQFQPLIWGARSVRVYIL